MKVSLKSLGYRSIFRSPILKANSIEYYSCRSPDNECVLVAVCKNDQLERTLSMLQKNHQDFMKRCDLLLGLPCRTENCDKQRDCPSLSFLPYAVKCDKRKDNYYYMLRYDCFEFSKFVRLQDIAKKYYIGVLTACRLTFSLLTLADYLIRLGIDVDCTMENLLVNLDSACVTLIDWSNAKVYDGLTLSSCAHYHQEAAKIVLKLTGFEHKKTWEGPSELRYPAEAEIFDFLETLTEIDWTNGRQRYKNLIDAAISFHDQQQKILGRFLDVVGKIAFEPQASLYELIPKK